MMVPEQIPELRSEAKRIIEHLGCELVDVSVRGPQQPRILLFFVDRKGGVTIDDCAAISRELSFVIEERFRDYQDYRLEVSSPGLDRPLKMESDFARHVESDLRIEWTLNGKYTQTCGTLKSVSNGTIELLEANQKLIIPVASIIRAKVKLKW
jgi:ribosome maturation factor RimP